MGKIEVVVGPEVELARAFKERTEALAGYARREGRPFSLVLPGGSTAEAFLPALAGAAVEWSAVDFFWGDERAVPWDHADSNYRLAASLLDRADPGRVHRMRADEPDLAAAAQDYEREMRKALGPSARLDLALMGMGPDGHVCSLFPGHPLLAEKTRWVAAVTDSPKPPPKRMTMTLPALALTDLLVVGAFGAGKAEALHAALDDEGSALPVALVARAAARALFLLDEPAASRLARR